MTVLAFSTVPTPLYAIYQARDGFSTFVVTVIFAAYAVGVLLALLLAGHASDWLGRRRALVPALLASVASAVVFLLWRDLGGLLLGRVLSGMSVGIVTATATAYLAELDLGQRPGASPKRAQVLATTANLGGLGLGPIIAGVLAETVDAPLTVPFVLFGALLAVATIAVALAPETVTPPETRPAYRPQRVAVPAEARGRFFGAAGGAFVSFAAFGLFTSLAPSFLVGTFGQTSHARRRCPRLRRLHRRRRRAARRRRLGRSPAAGRRHGRALGRDRAGRRRYLAAQPDAVPGRRPDRRRRRRSAVQGRHRHRVGPRDARSGAPRSSPASFSPATSASPSPSWGSGSSANSSSQGSPCWPSPRSCSPRSPRRPDRCSSREPSSRRPDPSRPPPPPERSNHVPGQHRLGPTGRRISREDLAEIEPRTRRRRSVSSVWGRWAAASPIACSTPVIRSPRPTAPRPRPSRCSPAAWSGCGTPREVAASTDVVLSMVTDDEALEAITAGPHGLLAGLQPGQVYVDMSTVSPQASRRLAERVRARGAHMLDAPVSGSIPQAESGTLAIMVGGDRQAFAAVEPLLRELGQTVTHIGPNGQGLVLKLAINISLAVQTLAFSEGLLLAERAGVDPEVAAEVMSTSSIGSPMLKARIPLLLDLPEHAWFDVRADAKGHPAGAPHGGRPPDPPTLGHGRRPDPDHGTRPRLRTSRPCVRPQRPREHRRPTRGGRLGHDTRLGFSPGATQAQERDRSRDQTRFRCPDASAGRGPASTDRCRPSWSR